uniref:Cytochrome P450 n=1 Tax=Trichogramma kaykai TaxID=54128 RepID=A0ABD2X9B1_9HYME
MHLLLVLIFVLICAYWYLTRTHNYWVKQNVPTMPGCVPGFGHVLPSLLMRETLKDLADRAYRGFADSSVVGFYFMRKPMIVLRDPNLVKLVLQSDFASFRNGRKINEKADPLMAKNPFFIHDLKAWRNSRARVVSHLSAAILNASLIPRRAEDFFRNTLLGILKHRKRQSQTSKPNDFLQFVLDTNIQDDVESIIADVIIYHADVYETSSSTLAFFVNQLLRHSEEQEKIRQHVRDATRTNEGGQLTYEALKAMNYLEQAVYESLRLIPPVPALLQSCVQNTTLVSQDGLECRLCPGDGVLIPVLGLQNDPKHWDEPEAFRPERFGPEQLAKRHKYLFLAFGEGPRMCVGMRLGLLLSIGDGSQGIFCLR